MKGKVRNSRLVWFGMYVQINADRDDSEREIRLRSVTYPSLVMVLISRFAASSLHTRFAVKRPNYPR